MKSCSTWNTQEELASCEAHILRQQGFFFPFSVEGHVYDLPMPSKHHTDSSKENLLLDTSDFVLTVVRDAARLAPIPYLKDAAGLALGIVNVIQGVRGNKDAFRRLADDACGLVYAILCRHATAARTASGVSADLLDNLQELLKTLTAIERFAKKKVSRNVVMRVIMRQSDLGTIQEFRETLRQSLDLFGLKSNITIQEYLASISSQQVEILQAFREGNPSAGIVENEQESSEQINQTQSNGNLRRAAGEDSDFYRKPSPKLPDDSIRASTASSSPRHPLPPFPDIQLSRGTFTMSSVGGDHITVDSSHHVSNSNSGNTTTTITKNSNNDSSVRVVQSGRGKRRR